LRASRLRSAWSAGSWRAARAPISSAACRGRTRTRTRSPKAETLQNTASDDLVICGHNFPSHFGPVKYIEIGAEVIFTAVDGAVYRYVVTNRETVRPTDVEYMVNNAAPQAEPWDLTLFTCNTGGQTRCAVRCIRAEDLK